MKKLDFETIDGMKALMPDIINPKSEIYDSIRVNVKDDFFYLVDNHSIYMNAILSLWQPDFNKAFEHLVWIVISVSSFIKISENMSGIKERVKAKLISKIPFYDDTENLEVLAEFHLKDNVRYPNLIIKDNHVPLYKDYTKGVKKEDYLEWQRILGAFRL